MSWFEVDKDGLRQLLEGRDKSFVLRELVQNAWDEEGVTLCKVALTPIPGKRAAWLTVEDDAPEGFYDLRHAYTMYANTRKRTSPVKRGRFNLGEKQVLALCRKAEIVTTTGGVAFKSNGTRSQLRRTTESGSIFTAEIPMTRGEIEDAVKAMMTFIPPQEIKTLVNGVTLEHRKPVAVVRANLATEYEDEEGWYRETRRNTEVRVFEPLPGERPMIYELGLPIIETGDRWHYDVQQRVPMTADRDNVKPSFLQDVRAEVANVLASKIEADAASEEWVRSACEDDRISNEAFETVVTKRWGRKRAVADPNDPQSREKAIANGYTIVPTRALSKAEWDRARETGAIPPTSKMFPTQYVETESVPRGDWTADMKRLEALTEKVGEIALGLLVRVTFVRSGADAAATYGRRTVNYNLKRLNGGWLRKENKEAQLKLVVHELGHEFGGHLDEAYYNGLAKIAARLAMADPSEFEV